MSESVRRVVGVLELLAHAEGEVGIRRIADQVGASKSSVQRLLSAMVDGGLAARDPDSTRYRLGPLCLVLGMAFEQATDLRRVAHEPMGRLRDSSGETVGLSVRVGEEMFHIAQQESRSQLRRSYDIGRALPLWAGAPARVLLADLSPESAAEVVRARRPAQIVPAAPPVAEEMLADVRRCREDGWATAVEETIPGVTSIAVPVRGIGGRLLAALTLTGPSQRLGVERAAELVPDLQDAAATIERLLGGA